MSIKNRKKFNYCKLLKIIRLLFRLKPELRTKILLKLRAQSEQRHYWKII